MNGAHAFLQDPGSQPRTCLRIGPGIAQAGLAQKAAFEADGHLEALGPSAARCFRYLHAIGRDGAHRDVRKVGADVGRKIGARIVHLIKELLLDCSGRDAAAGLRQLGDDRAAVCLHFGNRKSAMGEVGDVFAPRVGEIAAGDLHAAFEQMADERAGAKTRPVIERPAEAMRKRRERERRIRNPAGYHDVRAGVERGEDYIRAKIRVGPNH